MIGYNWGDSYDSNNIQQIKLGLNHGLRLGPSCHAWGPAKMWQIKWLESIDMQKLSQLFSLRFVIDT